MELQSDFVNDLKAATAQIQKIGVESAASLKKLSDLEALLSQQSFISPDVQAAFADLKTQLQAVDDLVPDAPADTTSTTSTTTDNGGQAAQ